MAKTIKFSYKGVDYTLEFTRKSIEIMEHKGFVLSDISEKPMTILPTLFRGAFLAHHRFVKNEIIDEIFDNMTNRDELFTTLVGMYNEPISALMEEPSENNEGNIAWATD